MGCALALLVSWPGAAVSETAARPAPATVEPAAPDDLTLVGEVDLPDIRCCRDVDFDMTPDGSRIVAASQTWLRVIDLDGQSASVVGAADGLNLGWTRAVQISPDGRYAYLVIDTGKGPRWNGDLVVMRLDGNTPRVVRTQKFSRPVDSARVEITTDGRFLLLHSRQQKRGSGKQWYLRTLSLAKPGRPAHVSWTKSFRDVIDVQVGPNSGRVVELGAGVAWNKIAIYRMTRQGKLRRLSTLKTGRKAYGGAFAPGGGTYHLTGYLEDHDDDIYGQQLATVDLAEPKLTKRDIDGLGPNPAGYGEPLALDLARDGRSLLMEDSYSGDAGATPIDSIDLSTGRATETVSLSEAFRVPWMRVSRAGSTGGLIYVGAEGPIKRVSGQPRSQDTSLRIFSTG